MKLKKESSSIGACKMPQNEDDLTPNVITVNMETGKVYNRFVDEKKHKEETKINVKQESRMRLLQIVKSENSVCGFHLTRTKWDPYPWVSDVDENTPAEVSGLKVGDCVLEVNGEDVLGLRITDIAKLVRANAEHVTLLLWSAGCESDSDSSESLCDGPMPRTLQRLSIIVQSILSIIECPVCLETIPPPAMQCQNGHLLCVKCRIRAEKCPVCRDRYTPRRALIAEQIYAGITNAFNLCRTEDKLRQKLFGTNGSVRQQQQQQQEGQEQVEQQISIVNMVTTSTDNDEHPTRAMKSQGKARRNRLQRPANKFLTKLLFSKACTMDNLSNARATTETTVQMQSTNTDGPPLSSGMSSCRATPSKLGAVTSTNSPLPMMSAASKMSCSKKAISSIANHQIHSFSNQSHNSAAGLVESNVLREIKAGNRIYLDATGTNLSRNEVTKVNEIAKHSSMPLIQRNQSRESNQGTHLTTAAHDGSIIVTKVKPQCTFNNEVLLRATNSPNDPQTIESKNCSLVMLDKRPPRMRSAAITDVSNSKSSSSNSSCSSQCNERFDANEERGLRNVVPSIPVDVNVLAISKASSDNN